MVVIPSGSNRVDRKRKLQRALGYKPSMATPEYVLEATGYQIGGVPPFGHSKPVTVMMDEDLKCIIIIIRSLNASKVILIIEILVINI